MMCASGSVVEYRLAKARVAGSNPVSRFQKRNERCRVGIAHFFFESDPGLEGSKSSFHFGRRKAEVPRTSCAPSRASEKMESVKRPVPFFVSTRNLSHRKQIVEFISLAYL